MISDDAVSYRTLPGEPGHAASCRQGITQAGRASRDGCLAEAAGDPGPWRQQELLGRDRWDGDALHDLVREYVIEHLSDSQADCADGRFCGASIPLICQDWANTKAAYRFFSNDRVSEADILAGHFQSTCERVGATDGLVFMLHDTTEFVYKRESSEAIGITLYPLLRRNSTTLPFSRNPPWSAAIPTRIILLLKSLNPRRN